MHLKGLWCYVHSNDSHTVARSGRTRFFKGFKSTACEKAFAHAAGEGDASVLASKTYVLDLGGRSEQGFS